MIVEIPGRFRRVAAAFNEAAARERTPCDESSGSDHSPENMADLGDLVESFMEREGKLLTEINREKTTEEEEGDSSDDVDDYEDVRERLRSTLLGGGSVRRRIAAEVEAARETIGEEEMSSSKRQLMAFLRNKGFDAGLCKSRWERFGKNPSGKYEYIDVQLDGDSKRYIVETNLAAEFEIARPTERYLSLLANVPRVFVGSSDQLKHLVRVMCNEMRRSMRRVGIHVPPWRRNGYMQAKWFGHYKRTVNEASRVKKCDSGCGCDSKQLIGFEKSAKTIAFYGCKEEYRRREDGLKIGGLTIAFGNNGVDLQ